MGKAIKAVGTNVRVKQSNDYLDKLPDVGAAGIDRGIASIKRRGAKLKTDTAALAIAAMNHYRLHGDVGKINQVGNAVQSVYTRNAARCFFAWCLTFNSGLAWDDELKKIIHRAKGASRQPRWARVKNKDGSFSTTNFVDYSFWSIVELNEAKIFEMDKSLLSVLKRAIRAYNANIDDGASNLVRYNQLVSIRDVLVQDGVDLSEVDFPVPPAKTAA